MHTQHTHSERAYLPVHSRLHCNYITKTSNFRSSGIICSNTSKTHVCVCMRRTLCTYFEPDSLSTDMIKPAALELQNIYIHTHGFFCWKPIQKWVRRFHVSYSNDLSSTLFECCSRNMQNEICTMCVCVYCSCCCCWWFLFFTFPYRFTHIWTASHSWLCTQ